MQTDKVGMKELDRHLGKVLAKAQERPVVVYRWHVPWLCIVPDVVWERSNPWESLVPRDHPLMALSTHLDAATARNADLVSTVAEQLPSSNFPMALLLRVLVFKAVRDIQCERHLCDQIEYNMVNRWFVGLSPDCACVEEIVRTACQLSLLPAVYVSMTKLVSALVHDAPPASWLACQGKVPSGPIERSVPQLLHA